MKNGKRIHWEYLGTSIMLIIFSIIILDLTKMFNIIFSGILILLALLFILTAISSRVRRNLDIN
jgi:hypothetical protein